MEVVEPYFDWVMKVDQVFSCYQLDEGKKIWLATLEFKGYAMVWWNQVQIDVERLRRDPITTWFGLKELMKERFVPLSYSRDHHNKLQKLYQGSKSVEEYYQEMEYS